MVDRERPYLEEIVNQVSLPTSRERVLESRVYSQKIEDLRELFRSADNPIEVLLGELDADELRQKIDPGLLEEVRSQLQTIRFEGEEDFVTRAMDIMLPILAMTQKGRKDAYRTEERDMYSEDDMQRAVQYIRENKCQVVVVVGNVGSGKTTFSRELSRELGYKNIDVDRHFQIFRQEKKREGTLAEVLDYIVQKEAVPYVINHADLLAYNYVGAADLVVLLNPSKTELLQSRARRNESGAEGEWRTVEEKDYDDIAARNLAAVDALPGEIVHQNLKSGTLIKKIDH